MIDALRYKKRFLKSLILILISFLSIFFLCKFEAFRETILIVLVSGIFAYILKPLYGFLCEKTKFNKNFLAMAIILSIIFLILFFLIVLIPSMFKEGEGFDSLINGVESFINSLVIKMKFMELGIFDTIKTQITEKLNIILVSFASSVINNLINLSENILAFAVIPVLAYYFLAYGDLLSNRFLYYCPVDKRSLLKHLGRDVDRVLGKYILGQLLLSLVVGIMTFIGMLVLGIRFPLLLAFLNALLNIIPYFGAVLGAVPAIIVALVEGPDKVLGVIITFLIIQQIEGNLIAPKITAESIDMHPILIIILLLIGEQIGGLLGMVFIVPIAVVIKVLFDDLDYYMFL